MQNCKKHPLCSLLYRHTGRVKLEGIYRIFLGRRQGLKIWIVDGDRVCRELFPDFIMGGNDQRYRFNPEGDVWIDNRIGVEELEYTIAHELIERKLMIERGWSYARAHTKGGLALEKAMRERDASKVAARQRLIRRLGEKGRVDADALAALYRARARKVDGTPVWIVDGPRVRKDFYPDFCFSTHDLDSRFVPENEIWLDSAMSIEEAYYALLQRRTERKLLAGGAREGTAYDLAAIAVLDERARQARLVRRYEARLAPVRYGVREKGAPSR